MSWALEMKVLFVVGVILCLGMGMGAHALVSTKAGVADWYVYE